LLTQPLFNLLNVFAILTNALSFLFSNLFRSQITNVPPAVVLLLVFVLDVDYEQLSLGFDLLLLALSFVHYFVQLLNLLACLTLNVLFDTNQAVQVSLVSLCRRGQ
jgi:hypothetical protein